MKKNQKNGEAKSTLLAAAVMVLITIVSVFTSGCSKEEQFTNVKSQGQHVVIVHDTVINGIKIISELKDLDDMIWGIVTATQISTGEQVVRKYPLGGINVFGDENDTIDGMVPVDHLSYSVVTTVDSSTAQDVYFIEKTTKTYTDKYGFTTGQYTRHGGIWYLNGSTKVFDIIVDFPRRDAEIVWQSVNTSEAGTDGTYDYTLVTSQYGVKYLDGVSQTYGFKTLRRNAGSNQLIGVDKTNEGFEITASNQYGPTQGRSWIELTYHYSQTGDVVNIVEQYLSCGVDVPSDSSLVAQNFNLNWANPQLGAEVNLGSQTFANGVTVTSKRQPYAVGATGLFTRRFVTNWQTAVWSDGEHTFAMPSPSYQNHYETHELNAMSASNGYDRKQAVNTLHAKFHGANVTAPAKTMILVEQDDPTPDPPAPTIDGYVKVDSGLTYVNATTNNSWLKLRPHYTDGTLGTPFTVNVNLTNGMNCPALLGIYTNCASVITTGAGTVGGETLDHWYTNGDFTVYVYKKNFTVNCGAFDMVFIGSYEKAVYNPLNYNMPSSSYSYAVSSGDFTQNLGQVTENNTTYDKKMWTQYITASLNNHTQQHSGTAEVYCSSTIDRITPDYYGNLAHAYYTRTQKQVGSTFNDNVNFVYDNVILVMPGGNPANAIAYARNQATATAHNLPMAPSPNLYESAVWNALLSRWEPCKINFVGGTEEPSQWTYANANCDHTVMQGNALALGIGHHCTPRPPQNFYMSGPVGTLEYPINNASSSMTGTIVYW